MVSRNVKNLDAELTLSKRAQTKSFDLDFVMFGTACVQCSCLIHDRLSKGPEFSLKSYSILFAIANF